MKIICPHCNQKYNITDEYLNRELCCEKCGRNFIGKKAKFCPDCGVVNHPEALNCRSCDFQFTQLNTKIKPEQAMEQAMETLPLKRRVTIIPHMIMAICPHCTQSYTFSDGYINKEMACQCCHNSFVIAQAISCPRCKANNHPTWSYCQNCSMDLQTVNSEELKNSKIETDLDEIPQNTVQLIKVCGNIGLTISYVTLILIPIGIMGTFKDNSEYKWLYAGIMLALVWISSSIGKRFNKLILESIDYVPKLSIINIICYILFFAFRVLFAIGAIAVLVTLLNLGIDWSDLSIGEFLKLILCAIICIMVAPWYGFSTYSYFVILKLNRKRRKDENINDLKGNMLNGIICSCLSLIIIVTLIFYFRQA